MGTDINTLQPKRDIHNIDTDSIPSSVVSSGVCRQIDTRLDDPQDDGELTVAKAFKRKAIDQLVEDISVVGDSEKQISKIKLLLILAKDSDIGKTEREGYFYQAVNIAEQYFGTSYLDNRQWKPIVDIYRKHIADNDDISIRKSMMHDRNERRQREIMAAKNTQVYLSGITEPQHILDKLESRIGKVRLLITSEDSGEAIIEHNTLTGTPNNIRRTRVIVFKGGKNYSVAIDHGGNESANQINETDWKEYIKPIIDIYIEKMESLFCRDQHSNLESIQQKEAKEGVRILSLNKNYDIFLSRVIESIDPQLNTDANYIQDCIRAIDICRLITLQHSQSITKKAPHIPQLDNANILQEIDTILDGRITRRVLRMVTRMLLSRDETMNGLGYPSGLSKDKIHTLSKVLSIIRAYESMCLDMTTESAILMMTHGSKGGYWDTQVLEIFVDTLRDGKIETLADTGSTQTKPITPERQKVYEPYMHSWESITSTMTDIEEQYALLRDPKSSTAMRSAILLTIKELQSELMAEAGIRKLFLVMRHPETESDKRGGKQPGGNDEGLTKKGIQSAIKIGKGLAGIKLEIHTSETERGIAAAKLICEASQRSVSFIIENALRNRTKDLENNYGDSYLEKFTATHPDELITFINEINLSTKHDQVLAISHADTLKAMDVIINTRNQKDGIHVQRISVKNNDIRLYCFHGGELTHGDYFNTISTWRTVSKKVNTIIKKIFKETLYPMEMNNVDLFDLHDLLLDYINNNTKTDPEKAGKLIQALCEHPLTEHFSGILRKEGMSNYPPPKGVALAKRP